MLALLLGLTAPVLSATTAGANEYRITNCAEGQEQWLQYAMQLRYTVLTFDVPCTVTLTKPFEVWSGVTIQANQPVTFTGNNGAFSGFKIYDRSGVQLRNLTITRFGNPEARSANDPHDCIDIRRSTNVVLEHLTISLCGDKQVSMLERSTAYMRLNHFVGDLWHAQFVQVGAQSIVGDEQMLRSTLNWFDGDGYRMPNVNWGKVHSWNNVFDRPFASTQCERLAQCIFEKDVWIAKEPGHTMVKYDPGRGGCNDDQWPCIDEQGAGRVVAPRLENGARAPSFNPDSVFIPTYRYYAEEATAELRDRVRATAGAH